METNKMIARALFLSVALYVSAGKIVSQEDPYQWLEDVDSEKSLAFAEQHNKVSIEKLSSVKEYQAIFDKSLEMLNSTDRIAYPSINGEHVYNFWQDKEHVRGIWRRAHKITYYEGDPQWETLIDLDAMSKKDSVKWVYKGASGLYPAYDRYMVRLSKGGGDAVVIREFDPNSKEFFPDGFSLPEAKGNVSYLDDNTLVVSTDFGKNSLTTSGYPRQVKLWSRGTDLNDARLIFEGKETDVSSTGYILRDKGLSHLLVQRAPTFYTNETFIWENEKLVKLDIPEDSQINDLLNNHLILELKSDWTVAGKKYKSGELISLDFRKLIAGEKVIHQIIAPTDYSSVSGTATTHNKLLVNLLNNVKSELYIFDFVNGKWEKTKASAPDLGTIYLNSTDEMNDDYFFTFTNFLTPTTLYKANAGDNSSKPFRSLPAYFDASGYKVEQFKAKSNDGTMIPYFVVSSKNVKYDGTNPTLLYAYGGFEVPMIPGYSGVLGKAWLEHGGVYVLANIRGGGEFGPKWHQAGMKEKRQNIYNDFHSVAADLIAKKITSSKHLGIMGGSNGGLLVGVAFTQKPELYSAVVCAVPLLDMKRFNKLLAGASWMGEYGDPDKPAEWAYISKYSPYQNLKKGVKYPEVFFTTSTRDDRVHPGHARKMVAKMTDMGCPVYYYENTEGGHAGSSTNEQRAKSLALQYSYLLMKLKG